jgi:eukaryotic-like serine/threonine-protein kinase
MAAPIIAAAPVPLTAGSRLGPYEITAQIGVGGMGEVYRARDTNLKRAVAIKVLPDAVARDVDRLARFQREAEVLASLNHPNIGAIYGLEKSDGTTALVMELVEGPTLADHIAQNPIPIDEALSIAKQIAEALEAAHEQGIIHRDLKPGNIKVRSDGTVKVLDFGLAKALEPVAVSGRDLTASPTITSPAMTQMGVILGTAAYMSPEQARGKPVDKRSDVWAFGCVLYEMLTGRRAFGGEDISLILANVLKAEPDWQALPVEVSGSLRTVIKGCLEKDRARRIADMSVALFVMRTASFDSSTSSWAAAVILPRPMWKKVTPFAVTSLMTGALVGATVWTLTPEPPRAITRLAVTLPEGERFSAAGPNVVALSPDGRRLVYVANQRLNLRALDELEAAPIRGTDGGPAQHGRSPFFSPDGTWIGFWQAGQLRKVSVAGGAPVPLCEAQFPWGATWDTEDAILYGQGPQGIWRVSGQGGPPTRLIAVDAAKGEVAHGPQQLPGGDAVLFTLATGSAWEEARIVVQSLASGKRQVLVEGGRDARYVATGHLVYARAGTLFAVPFDVGSLAVTGAPVSLVEGVASARATTGAAHFSFARDALVYVPQGSADLGGRSLIWVDRRGRESPVPAPTRAYSWVRVSPDGTRLAMEVQEPANTDVWIYDLARNSSTRLTFAQEADRYPIWTPDGQRVVFTSGSDLAWRAADGTGEVERLATGLTTPRPSGWSSDGKRLVFDYRGPQFDVALLPLDGQRTPQPVIANEFATGRPAISPNARWMAYASDESGALQIHVHPFPTVGGGHWMVSTAGGHNPVWSPDGRELFYTSTTPPDAVMVVAVDTQTTFRPGTPRLLLQGAYDYGVGPQGRAFDIAPDGRFLMLKERAGTTGTSAAQIMVVQNWLEELKRRLPTK